ncbi:kelch-like protein 10 isoform X2 [Cylas formicarius]|uniref:kelch-like protein 10 isoform X2 n=1 Tax=Cylas formicarius TaxID=197179 RepID=UPI002958983D|nr:kelch-like protein 10 isoform X2 [Cylas formicarius]
MDERVSYKYPPWLHPPQRPRMVRESDFVEIVQIFRDFYSPTPNSKNLAQQNEMGESNIPGTKTSETIRGRSMSLEAMQALFELKENNQLCDATIVLDDGSEIPVHRALLCACSAYFRALFMTTLHNKEKTRVHLPGLSSEMLQTLLVYVYLRKLNLNDENVYSILIAADYLSLLGALELCCDYLETILRPSNCLSILQFAKDHFCGKLQKNTWKYILRNFTQIASQSLEILNLNLVQLQEIINSDDLNVKSEETVWEVILKWIEYEPDQRREHIVQLMKCIRLGLLDTQFFLERVKDHPYVASSEASRPMIIETLKFLYDLEMITHRDGEVITPEIARPRVPHEILFAIGGWSGGSPTNFIETYDTRADRWVKVEEVDPIGPRAYHGTAVVGFNIYVIGGFDGMDYFNSCRCFDAVNKTWREIAPMHARRCYVSTTVMDEIIYAMGGYDGHHRQNTAERYDFKTNQWTLTAPMNMQRSDASACTLNGKIYITGGFNGQECMHSAEVYDPEANQWTLIAPMRSRRSGVSCIAYHEQVYVVGGFNGISRMCSGEKYNPQTNTWATIPDMYNPRSNFAIEVIDDMIFAIGGFNGVTTIYHVECYDEKTNEWYEATDMNIYRSALSACVVDGLPNVQDYIHKHRDRLMEEKRQKMIAIENQRNAAGIGNHDNDNQQENIAAAVNANMQQLNILQQLNANLNPALPPAPVPNPEPMDVDEEDNLR